MQKNSTELKFLPSESFGPSGKTCKRLKLNCVPPTMQFDKGFQPQGIDFHDDYDGHSSGGEEDSYIIAPQVQMPNQGFLRRSTSTGSLPHFVGRDHFGVRAAAQLQMAPHTTFTPSLYAGPQPLPVDSSMDFGSSSIYTTPPPALPQQIPQTETSQASWRSESPLATFNAPSVQEVLNLGQLKIGDSGIASYIHNQSREIAARPAVDESIEDYEQHPIFTPGIHDFAVQIPREEMPSDREAEYLFEIFFRDVHPYIPVVNKNAFYRQWNGSRQSISPLLLEAILACAGRISPDPRIGLKWLNMASKHLDCFFDVPRISTIQALLLLLKARESAPQRGYFFRSYISIVTMMAMAKDLGRHVALSSSPVAVDFPASTSVLDMSDRELEIHVHFTYFVELLKLIRGMSDIFARLFAQAAGSNSWAGSPEFLSCGPKFDQWLMRLPPKMQIEVPLDFDIPLQRVESHFAGNLVIYGHLAKIMFHRPALAFARNFTATGQWKYHLRESYDSSRTCVRLTEAVLEVAATCPDPEFNSDAREYFSRAMRILEICIDESASMETKAQIEALRAAFSEDVSQPFVLNANFPFYSTPSDPRTSPTPSGGSYSPIEVTRSPPLSSTLSAPISQSRLTISPPGSEQGDSPNPHMVMMSQPQLQPSQIAQTIPRKAHHHPPDAGWNPQRIFDHWTTGFPGIASAPLPPSTLPTVPENGLVEGLIPPATTFGYQQSIPVVSPDMWQNTVAHVFAGTKRSWQYANQ
ncbi:hypothetical protein ABW21_db0206281 [Orbilia brochopaga]|nr:hypothetical protein ABW21_db0206281 [Drechslerella brochopaga]